MMAERHIDTSTHPLPHPEIGFVMMPPMDPKRHRFHTNLALIQTVGFVLLLAVLVVFTSEISLHNNRHLRAFPSEEDASPLDFNNNNGERLLFVEQVTFSYANHSCNNIYQDTPEPGEAQCAFARTCNEGEGIWAPFVFCLHPRFSTYALCALLSPFMLLLTILLFRMLASTAEDYFSPALEMLSMKLGFPPRFAGVSLLAVGNGAADVSSTVNAIVNDRANGYKLSLGALTGAAMLVGGVVAGAIVIVANGAPCRGALVRDVSMLALTVVVVWTHLSSGEIGPGSITLFFSLYGAFVVLVLVADLYHRGFVVPRLAIQAEQMERQRQLMAQEDVVAAAGEALNDLARNSETLNKNPFQDPSHEPQPQCGPPAITTVLTALSNYGHESVNTQQHQDDGWGLESNRLAQDRPIMLHGSHGILHGDGGGFTSHRTDPSAAGAGAENEDHHGPETPYSMLTDSINQVCTEPGTVAIIASSWKAAWNDGKEEIRVHAKTVWEDIYWNGDVSNFEKFLLSCELPFIALRKATVPIPCEGYYCRALVALSLVCSPFWLCFYLWAEHDVNMISDGRVWYTGTFCIASVLLGAMVLRFAPGGDGVMSMSISTPIALYGFFIAATWIDTIADKLVSLLDFLGIVLHIPGAIMGLTVLAWGNSMGDLSANVTMARKGLANMALTACFAGPVFNILMGLGLGFSSLAAATGNPEAKVSLPPSVRVGFCFIVINSCVLIGTGLFLHRGYIPATYGYAALATYTVYVVTSIVFQHKYGEAII